MRFSAFCTYLLAILSVLSAREAQQTPYEQAATEILEAAGVKGGLVVHIGCGDGRLTAALHANDRYLVHGLDSDATDVEHAREHIRSLGLYGRVTVDRLSGSHLPYIDGLVNLLVVQEPGDIPVAELMRVLCPNGVACIRTGDKWTKTVKSWPKEIDEWTHYLHDASNNAVAHDSVVGPPRRFQWVGSPRWSRHHDHMASMSACVSASGRIFYILDEGSRSSIELPSRWTLTARDAFNGTVLWKQPISSWVTQMWPFKSGPAQLPRRLVAVGDKVYVTLGLDGTALSALDAATGQIIRTYVGTNMTEELIFSEGVLLLMVKEKPPTTRWNEYVPKHRAIGQAKTQVASDWPWDQGSRQVCAIQADTGKILWQKEYPVAPLTLAADAGRVFFHDGQKVVCLNRQTGDQLWTSSPVKVTSPMPVNFGPTLVAYKGVVLLAGGNPSRVLTAMSAETGKTLWASTYEPSGHNCPHDLLVVEGLAWAGATAASKDSGIFTGWDPYTGQVERQFPPDVDTYWFHHRCYRSRATDRYILPSRTGVEFIDFQAERWMPHHWVRGGCLYGIMPCNGLLYAPPHDCACYFEAKLNGFCALAGAHTNQQYTRAVSDDDRLERGPAYGAATSESSGPEDWPTYRHDPARSGSTKSLVPAELKLLWQTSLAGRLTSPVIADGKVYVASIDTHTLYALEEETGQVAWSYTAGGRVDSPPTIYKGRVLFGCTDGWVYCLGACDGQLVWRFQAAPEDLRLTAFEQLESVWPLHGSVLVQQAVVYCVAGRSMFLDGGLRFLRLDPTTGVKISEHILDDSDPGTGENLQVHVKGLNMPVALPDVLSGDGRYIFMRSQRFDLEGNRQQIAPYSADHDEQGSQQYGEGMHLFCPTGFLDDAYMHRTYWVFGRSWASGAGGYYRAGRYAPAGRIMVFDDVRVYGFGRQPQYYRWTTPMEHHLFAAAKSPDSQAIEYHWTDGSVPLLVCAMVLADETLFIAGPPDVLDEEKAFDSFGDPNTITKLQEQDAALEGQRGALLWAVSAPDGTKLAEYKLESPPVWDGMAAANGRLYLCSKSGNVQCFIGVNYPPVVDAGEDQQVYPMTSAVLGATVSDDGLPKVDPCDPSSSSIGVITTWAKVEGPGEVTFSDPFAADTNAFFSRWGNYTLRLTAFDGRARRHDDIDIRVFRPGDLDRDDDVDVFDLSRFVASWLYGQCNVLNQWCDGADQTADGAVGLVDYATVSSNWLSGVYPAAPTDLSAVPGYGSVSLDWDDNTEADIAGYNVYRSVTCGWGYAKVNQSLAASSHYLDTDVTNYLSYYYRVAAEDAYGYESPYSDEVFACPGVQPVVRLLASVGVTSSAEGRVSLWEDQAKNNDARQDVAEDRPVLLWKASDNEPAIEFDGTGKHLDVNDSTDINMGGPYSGKTLVIVFKTGSDISSRQVLWEQGGAVRGLSFYIDGGSLYINGWNLNEVQWGPMSLNTSVSANAPYVAILVMDSNAGTLEGFVNGTRVGGARGVSVLYNHSDDCAFGHVQGATKFHDGSTRGPANFAGQIAEFYQYNKVLSATDCGTLAGVLMTKYGLGRYR